MLVKGWRRRAPIVVILTAVVCTGVFASPAGACTRVGGVRVGCSDSSGSRQRSSASPRTTLMRLLNEERVSQGLQKLAVDQEATRMAREHARRMARRGRVYHNPELKTSAGRRRLGDPAMLGENVGVGPSSKSVHKAFMRSRDHRANILRSGFRELGIAVYDDGDSIWVVQVFLKQGGSGARTRARTAAPLPSSRSRIDRPRPRPAQVRHVEAPAGSPVLVDSWGAGGAPALVDRLASFGAGPIQDDDPPLAPPLAVLGAMLLALTPAIRYARRRPTAAGPQR